MKIKYLNIIASLCLAAFTITSCLNNDEIDFEFSKNASISNFSINNIDTKVTVKKDGKDTVIIKTLLGSDYKFSINQNTGEIFNVDSLPLGTDVKKVVPNITADTPGIYIVTDKDTLWQNGDSLNFENPVKFKVMAYSGQFGRVYTARINVHQQNPDTMTWTKVNGNFNKLIQAQKAVYAHNQIFVFSKLNDYVFMTNTANGQQWTNLKMTNLPQYADYRSAMYWNNSFYLLANHELYTSTDGMDWEKSATDMKFNQLVANIELTSSKKITAVTEDNLYTESVDGVEWTTFEEMPSTFPQDVNYASYPLRTNQNLGRLIAMGKSAAADTTTVAWSQLESEHSWTQMSYENNASLCPNFEKPTLIHYNDRLYAFGGPVETSKITPAFQNFYSSTDHGISWKKETKILSFPDSFANLYGSAQGNYSCIVDKDNYIWIMWGNSGEVWKGRINRLGFEKQ